MGQGARAISDEISAIFQSVFIPVTPPPAGGVETAVMTVQPRKKVWKNKRPAAVTVVAWGIAVLFVVRLYQVFQPLVPMHVLEEGLRRPLFAGFHITPFGNAVLVSASYL